MGGVEATSRANITVAANSKAAQIASFQIEHSAGPDYGERSRSGILRGR